MESGFSWDRERLARCFVGKMPRAPDKVLQSKGEMEVFND